MMQLALAGGLEGQAGGRGLDALASGPYGVVFALGVQLLVLQGGRSFLSGLCGLAAGVLVRKNFLGMRKARLPGWLVASLARVLGGAPPPRVRIRSGRMPGQDFA